MQLLYDNVCEHVECTVKEDCINIDFSAVKHSISKLKAGKHDGFYVLSSNFILNGTELLDHHLSTLFTLMLSHCYAPDSFCMSTMIPLPKGSGFIGDVKSYRGITLSSLLSKLFDTCVISSQFDSLYSNDLQFAYKPQTSTIQCVSSVIETITYYVDHDGNVFMPQQYLMIQIMSVKNLT